MSRREKAALISMSILLVVAASAGLLLRMYWMPVHSMAPTLVPGDRIVASRLPRRPSALHRGDIVVFQLPEKALTEHSLPVAGGASGARLPAIKRLVGLPGERIRIKGGDGVYINGRRLKEPYIRTDDQIVQYEFPEGGGEYEVPRDSVFVLGDNRNNSMDSHFFEALPAGSIIGKCMAIYYPFSRIRMLK